MVWQKSIRPSGLPSKKLFAMESSVGAGLRASAISYARSICFAGSWPASSSSRSAKRFDCVHHERTVHQDQGLGCDCRAIAAGAGEVRNVGFVENFEHRKRDGPLRRKYRRYAGRSMGSSSGLPGQLRPELEAHRAGSI